MFFADRLEAGRKLGEALVERAKPDAVVLGLPRGGVPVAAEAARVLGAPLDVVLVRKLGVPTHPELAMGAIGEHGARVVNDDVMRSTMLSSEDLERVAEREQAELERRAAVLRQGRRAVPISGRPAIVVDDGVATGSTMRVACQVVASTGASEVLVAVPVGARRALSLLEGEADDVVCLYTPRHFFAVGQWYGDFTQVTDGEVVELLRASDAG